MNGSRSLSTYDIHNNKIHVLTQDWTNHEWANDNQITYTYNANHLLLNELLQEWNGFAWENDMQGSLTYDINNNAISGLIETWNGVAWENYYLYSSTYDEENNRLSSLSQFWNGIAWENEELYSYAYDAHQNLLSALYQYWEGGAWLSSNQSLYSYDADNVLMGESNVEFDDSGTDVLYGDSTHYYFHTLTNLKDLTADFGSILLYPNPSSGKFTIRSESHIRAIEIYDLAGKRIYAATPVQGQHDYDINFTGYAKGIYMIRMYEGMNMYTRNIVVQ